jgi:hypothetical protein
MLTTIELSKRVGSRLALLGKRRLRLTLYSLGWGFVGKGRPVPAPDANFFIAEAWNILAE